VQVVAFGASQCAPGSPGSHLYALCDAFADVSAAPPAIASADTGKENPFHNSFLFHAKCQRPSAKSSSGGSQETLSSRNLRELCNVSHLAYAQKAAVSMCSAKADACFGRHVRRKKACPLYPPQKQTSGGGSAKASACKVGVKPGPSARPNPALQDQGRLQYLERQWPRAARRTNMTRD
jgi:hypothetical protein